MSLLTIAQLAAQSTGDLATPTVLVGNTDPTAVRLLAMAKLALRRVHKMYPWTILQREYTFTTVPGTADYALPDDFDRFIDDTAWDRSHYWNMRGPLTPQEWQIFKSGLAVSVALRKRFRVKRSATNTRTFFIDPTPPTADSSVFEYISNSPVQSNASVLQTTWQADTDTTFLDEDIITLDTIWRLREVLGLSYQEPRDEADAAIDQAWARDGGMPTLFTARRGYRLPPVNVPQTGFGPP